MTLFSRKRLRKGIAGGLIVHLVLPLIVLTLFAYPVSAAEGGLTKDDAYKGLAIVLGLIVIGKVMKSLLSEKTAEGPSPGPSSSGSSGGDKDFELLARAIHAEARGEPYEGQVAVGAVILNRVESNEFPNTVREVIYAPGQFTSVSDGQINLTPNETSYRAAKDALAGKDPSKGALFFYNPKTARTLSWLRTRPTTVQIGNHVFAK